MLNINLNNLDTSEKDNVGSNYKALETDIYDAEIKLAYLIESKSSKAKGLELLLLIDGQERSFSIFFSTKEGKYTQINKDTKKEEVYFKLLTLNALFKILLNKDLEQLSNNDWSKKHIKKYNYTLKTDENIEVDTIPSLTGKKIKVAITNILTNNYKDPSKTSNKNDIDKFFDERGYTSSELVNLQKDPTTQPEFITKWLEVHKGKTIDKFDKTKAKVSTSVGSKSVTELNLDDEEL